MTRILILLLCIPFLVFVLSCPVYSREVTIVLAMCDKGETSKDLFVPDNGAGLLEFSRQYDQTLTLIKSLLISWTHGKKYHPDPDPEPESLHLILFSNKKTSFESLKSEVFSWDRIYTEPLRLTYRPVNYPNGTEWMDGVYIPCTYLRLLLPELLREQDKVIWLDTDILLLRDIRLLWNKFTMFDYRHMLAAAPPPDLVKFTCNGQMFRRLKVPSSQRRKFPNFNSGVLLMDLAKLRQSRFMEWVNSMKKYKKELKCGDQTLLNWYAYFHPGTCLRISYSWNYYTLKQKTGDGATQREHERTVPGISLLHGNMGKFWQPGAPRAIFRKFQKATLNSTFSFPFFVNELREELKGPLIRTKSDHLIRDNGLKYFEMLGKNRSQQHAESDMVASIPKQQE